MPRGVPFRSRAIEYVFEWCVLARAGILSMPAFVSFNLHENGGEWAFTIHSGSLFMVPRLNIRTVRVMA